MGKLGNFDWTNTGFIDLDGFHNWIMKNAWIVLALIFLVLLSGNSTFWYLTSSKYTTGKWSDRELIIIPDV